MSWNIYRIYVSKYLIESRQVIGTLELKFADDITILDRTEIGICGEVDVLAEESHAAIAQQEVTTTRVIATKSVPEQIGHTLARVSFVEIGAVHRICVYIDGVANAC